MDPTAPTELHLQPPPTWADLYDEDDLEPLELWAPGPGWNLLGWAIVAGIVLWRTRRAR